MPDDLDPGDYDLLSDAEEFFKEDSNDDLADAARVFGLQASNGGGFTPENGHDADGLATRLAEGPEDGFLSPSSDEEVQE